MARIILYIMKFLIALLAAVFFNSCGKSIEGSGNIVRENRPVSEFKGIEVSNGIEVELELSNRQEVTVEADDNLKDEIKTTVNNGILTISTSYNSLTNATMKVYVKMPEISYLQSSSASRINGKNILLSENLEMETSSAGNIQVEVEAHKLRCQSSSGSVIAVSGKALQAELTSSSASEVNARDLIANEVSAAASSGSSIDTHVLKKLRAEASSGASVEFKGMPQNIEKSENSGGSVSQM